VTVGE
jgi:hypothetical protein